MHERRSATTDVEKPARWSAPWLGASINLSGFSLVYALCGLLLTTSCVTEFDSDPVSTAPSLVVEGEITDQPGPYTVKLTRTADYTFRSVNLLETGATVTISDNMGNQEVLKEQPSGGTYLSSAGGMRGVAGRSYKVTIQTKAGKHYESTAEVLQAAPPIQKLYYQYTKESGQATFAKNQGWNVYLDTQDPETPGNYYRWSWTHYEFTALCGTRELPDGTFTADSCCSNCWNISRCYNCINVNSDANINGKAISRQFIMRAPYTSQGLYYLEVQQQAISKGAYEFWKSARGLVNHTGGLFDAAPATLQGNLRCVDDPAQAVYGYFGATGIAEQYIYVDRSSGQDVPDLEPLVYIPQPTVCVACQNTPFQTRTQPRWWKF